MKQMLLAGAFGMIAATHAQAVPMPNAASARPCPPRPEAYTNRSLQQQDRQMRLCHARTAFGFDQRKSVDVVYVSQGFACGFPPFFGFSYPTNS